MESPAGSFGQGGKKKTRLVEHASNSTDVQERHGEGGEVWHLAYTKGRKGTNVKVLGAMDSDTKARLARVQKGGGEGKQSTLR